jgi:hypothetical protein
VKHKLAQVARISCKSHVHEPIIFNIICHISITKSYQPVEKGKKSPSISPCSPKSEREKGVLCQVTSILHNLGDKNPSA